MAENFNTVYLVTGASRGIGFGLVERLVGRPGVVVFAGIRDLSKREDVEKLNGGAAAGSKAVAVQLRAGNVDDAKALPAALDQQGVNRLDVVVANAGISNYYGLSVSTPLDQVREHFEINTIGMLLLFQSTWPFLERSAQPIFVYVSTAVASMTHAFPLQAGAYGASKAAGNYFVTKFHQEHPQLVAFAISPGWVQTEMGNRGARSSGMEAAPTTVDESVSGILSRIDDATREKDGGKFKDFAETDIAW